MKRYFSKKHLTETKSPLVLIGLERRSKYMRSEEIQEKLNIVADRIKLFKREGIFTSGKTAIRKS